MSNKRLPMRKIREILRLRYETGLKNREIAVSQGLSHTCVADYLHRAKACGIKWPVPDNLSDEELEKKLYPSASGYIPAINRPLPDFPYIHKELREHKKTCLTLTQLWVEYKEDYPDGYQYTQFCEHYRHWKSKLDYCLRQDHKPGEKLFVDYGDGLSIVNKVTGEIVLTQLFVGVWGASNYTYAEASLSQNLPSWICSHIRAFEYFGCAPHIIVPDCLKSGVTKPCFYEPEVNTTYEDMAQHYGTAVLPARPQHPKDKAKVENGVLIAKRWILSVLRHRTFYSLAELNAAIRELLEVLNNRLLKKVKRSRKELFDTQDRPAARALPEKPYEYAEWKKATVNLDYHIEIDSHYYSVPFKLLREKLDVRITAGIVEAFYKGSRIAAHARSFVKHQHTTVTDHMPTAHREYTEWTPSRIINWAAKTGISTKAFVEKLIESRFHPEQGYRAAMGILRMEKTFGQERMESACARALYYRTYSYKAVRSILEQGLDKQSGFTANVGKNALPMHGNVRGGQYYN